MEQLKSHLRAGRHKHQLSSGIQATSVHLSWVISLVVLLMLPSLTVLITVLLKLSTKLLNTEPLAFSCNANKFGTLPKSGKGGRSFPYTVVVQTIYNM